MHSLFVNVSLKICYLENTTGEMIDLNLCFTESWCFLKDRYNSGRCWGSNHWGRSWLASFPLDPRLLESGPSSLSLRRAKLKPRLRELAFRRNLEVGLTQTSAHPTFSSCIYGPIRINWRQEKEKRSTAQIFSAVALHSESRPKMDIGGATWFYSSSDM